MAPAWIRRAAEQPWVRHGLVSAGRSLLFALLALSANIALLTLFVLALVFVVLGVGVVALPVVINLVRELATRQRTLAAEWAGVPVGVPYRPAPAGADLGTWRRFRWVVTDPATWRDLLWLYVEIPVGVVLGLLPAALVVYGVEGIVVAPLLGLLLNGYYGYGAIWPMHNALEALLAPPQGVVILLAGLAAGPLLLRLHAEFVRALLGPTRAASLARRVEHLAETRAESLDAQAAELRRIERDLHDGAQARLVALSLNIGLAETLIAHDPVAAQRLLAEARENSGRALVELRDLVRGIHPPVLAERGLAGAVQALALAVPLPVDTDLDLTGRPPPPVESAVYFAVAEALANVTKHSGARRAWIGLRHAGGRLTARVGDDGRGGADPAGGTGLRGIERRLAAFDGTMTVASPPGGPTVVSMELPCELSSPRTSPSSGTD